MAVHVLTNRVPNPSLASSTAGYVGRQATISRSTDWSASGAGSLQVTPSDAVNTDSHASIEEDAGALRLGMQPGKTYTAVGTIRLAAMQTGTPSDRARTLVVFTKNPSGYQENRSAQAPNAAGATQLRVTFTVPPDATEAFVRLYNGTAQGGGDVWWDGLMLVEGTYAGAYFDGDTPDTAQTDYAWTGTAHASMSTATTNSILEALSKTPVRLMLAIDNTAGANIGSIVRTDPTGTHSVRVESGQLPTTSASILIRDYEYPLTYKATITYTVYSVTGVALGSLTIDAGHPLYNTQRGLLHLTLPLRPESGLQLNNGDGFSGSFISRWDDGRESRHTVHEVVGREDPVVVLQKAASRTGSMDINCPDLQTAQLLEMALAQPVVFQLRQSDQWTLAVYFVPTSTSLTHSEDDWTHDDNPERRWTVTVQLAEVAWPTGYVVPITVWVWNDVIAAYSDWNAVMASFETWADLLERQES